MPERLDMPEAGAPVADAVPGNWVDTRAPAFARPYLRLARADRPVGSWLLFIPCLWGLLLAIAADPGSLRPADAWIAAGCALGAVLMRGAGCTWNDIADRHIDARVARTRSRPLPSGQVTVAQALIWMAAQAGLAALILITFNPAAILTGLASLVLVAVYPFAKRFTWWPQLFLGLAFNWGVLLAWTAHAGALGWPAVPMYLAGVAWTLFYDTIYAHQDREDDALIGVRSTARLFGARTPAWLAGFLAAAVLLMAAAVVLALAPRDAPPPALALGLAGVWAFGWHLWWQLRRLDVDDPALCLRLFRSNRVAGLLPAPFLAAALLA
jgi:4-hydroxybenzoate polyprenyltransferase